MVRGLRVAGMANSPRTPVTASVPRVSPENTEGERSIPFRIKYVRAFTLEVHFSRKCHIGCNYSAHGYQPSYEIRKLPVRLHDILIGIKVRETYIPWSKRNFPSLPSYVRNTEAPDFDEAVSSSMQAGRVQVPIYSDDSRQTSQRAIRQIAHALARVARAAWGMIGRTTHRGFPLRGPAQRDPSPWRADHADNRSSCVEIVCRRRSPCRIPFET